MESPNDYPSSLGWILTKGGIILHYGKCRIHFYISSYKHLKASVASLSAVLHLSHNFMEVRYIIAAVA